MQSIVKAIYGWFEQANDASPTFDPGFDVMCPLCLCQLSTPMKTISFMRSKPRNRSYFYRTHKDCYESAERFEQHKIMEIESNVIDVEEWPNELG